MKYLVMIIMWVCVVVALCCEMSEAADFTVDNRSLLHIGASGGIAGTVNILAAENNIPQVKRNIIAGTISGGIGLYKEFVVDDYHDWGDITFNVVGIVGALYVTEEFMIVPVENGLAVVGSF